MISFEYNFYNEEVKNTAYKQNSSIFLRQQQNLKRKPSPGSPQISHRPLK